MNFSEIPCIRWDANRQDQIQGIVRNCAQLLQKWSKFYLEKYPRKFRKFRNLVMSGERNPGNLIPSNQILEFHKDIPKILQMREPNCEFNDKSIEQVVLENFSAMGKHRAKKWYLNNDNGLTIQDYLQEAYMTIVEAMYQYTREDIALSTFIGQCLKNKMINVTNQSNSFCPLTNEDLKLVVSYREIHQSMISANFHEVVEVLGLSPQEIMRLSLILRRIYSANQIEDNNKEPFSDYTQLRAEIDRVVDIVEQNDYIQSLIGKARLTSDERFVIERAIYNPAYGWQTDLANELKLTKQRIGQIYTEARRKISVVLGNLNDE